MNQSIKNLIKEFKELEPNLTVKYKSNQYASIEIYNAGGLISVLEPYEFRQKIDLLKAKV